MRRFYASGAFRSLTYREMPFVLMPRIWAWLSASSHKVPKKEQRAHGDGLMVDYDSPEALEEVFWRLFAGGRYLRDDRLVPMTADEEILGKFRAYVTTILNSRPGPADQTSEVSETSEVLGRGSAALRYLSKNNNNILRLPSLYRAFPNAVVIVPFREPAQHANSLLVQHRRFVEKHRADRFARKYMTWLGHHEFGSDHRPFRFPGGRLIYQNTDGLNYWMELWINTYEWLLSNAPESIVFQGYEDLCGCLEDAWTRLAAVAEIPIETVNADEIALKRRAIEGAIDAGLERLADEVYLKLVERASPTTSR
jgi:hypothetical protein